MGGVDKTKMPKTEAVDKPMPKIEEIMNELTSTAKILLPNKPFESIASLEKKGNDWEAIIEVVERRAIPDSQDIIGRYLFKLVNGKDVESWKQIGFRRRNEVGRNE